MFFFIFVCETNGWSETFYLMIQDKDYTMISIASQNELAEVQSKSQDMI